MQIQEQAPRQEQVWEVVQRQPGVQEEEPLERELRDGLVQDLVVAEDHCAQKLVMGGDREHWTSARFVARHPQHPFGQEWQRDDS